MGKIPLPTCLWCGATFQPSGSPLGPSYAGHCSRKCQHEAKLAEAPIKTTRADRKAAKRLAQLEAERARHQELVVEYKGKIQAQGEDEVFKEFPAVFRFFNWPNAIGKVFGSIAILYLATVVFHAVPRGTLNVMEVASFENITTPYTLCVVGSLRYYLNKRQRFRAFKEAKEELQQD